MPTQGADFQFGYQHHLYIGALNVDASNYSAQCLTNYSTSNITGANVITWWEYPQVRDVSVAGTPNTIDVTTREDARQGLQAEAIVTTARSITFQIRYLPIANYPETASQIMQKLFKLLRVADKDKSPIAIMELDNGPDPTSPITSLTGGNAGWIPGTIGIVGNANISISNPKPVQDLVVADVTATFASFGHFVQINNMKYFRELKAVLDA